MRRFGAKTMPVGRTYQRCCGARGSPASGQTDNRQRIQAFPACFTQRSRRDRDAVIGCFNQCTELQIIGPEITRERYCNGTSGRLAIVHENELVRMRYNHGYLMKSKPHWIYDEALSAVERKKVARLRLPQPLERTKVFQRMMSSRAETSVSGGMERMPRGRHSPTPPPHSGCSDAWSSWHTRPPSCRCAGQSRPLATPPW